MFHILHIISACLLILVILGGVFLWRPQYQDFREKELEFQEKEMELEQKKEHYANLAGIYDELSEYEEELFKIDFALPQELSIPTLFYFIQKKSSENGLILKDMKVGKMPSGQSAEGVIQRISFSVSVSGSYSAFKNFLSTIYKNAKLIEVNSISFSSSEERIGLFDFNLTLSTHFYPKPKIRKVFIEKKLPRLPETE